MNKNTIIVVVGGIVLVALAAGYFLFVKPSSTVAVTETAPASPAEVTFVNLAAQLEPLGFDTSILKDPRFEGLVDIHTGILPEPTGRRDPFAPLGR